MADVQLENGFTRIANELLEALAMYDFTGQERKFLDAVIRLSYGCGKKTATFQSWSQCETFGLARQCLLSTRRKDGILDKLAKANIVIVDYTTKTVGIQKYYKYWQIKMKDIVNTKGFCSLIDYNLKCNVQLTKVSYSLHWSKPQLTRLSATAYKKVSHSLQEHDLNPHDDKPKTPPKDIKDNKDNNDHDLVSSGIQSDLTIIQGAILQKWGKQIIESPPVSHITTAIQEYDGKDRILEAIERIPVILKKPDRMTLMSYIGKVAENPTWYLTPGTPQPKSKAVKQEEKVSNARKVYQAILNDERADKEDESYKQALEQAKCELERAEEVFNVSGT